MINPTQLSSVSQQKDGVLKTGFVTPEQTAALTQILNLDLDDCDQVGGGLRAAVTCQCINCCSGH